MPLDLVASATAIVQHLAQFDVWVPGFSSAAVDPAPAVVALLEPLEHESRTYAILTVRRGTGITGRILLDPDSADLIEATAVQTPGTTLPPYVDPGEALRHHPAIAAMAPQLAAAKRILVWQYCLESGSRFQLFWHIKLIGHAPIFVRVDGTVFNSLTPV